MDVREAIQIRQLDLHTVDDDHDHLFHRLTRINHDIDIRIIFILCKKDQV